MQYLGLLFTLTLLAVNLWGLMLIAGLYVVLNLLADIATILVTPKLRTRL